ncbi:MAG: hypothetical protein KKC68_09355, partial [Candidatus Thermoplasmatota archaeon]|nr:hypothetical protein [Candidatus Thermoplasmatota archaeon]MBU1941965.1 hypothetical protein [Candidatus Thermoplasmatota archaeon]
NRKIISILICMLLSVTVSAVTANLKQVDTYTPRTLDIVWEDNFDSYASGTSLHGVGGWEGWDNDPQWTGYVTDNYANSLPNSVDIADNTDLVQRFSGVNAGTYNFSCYQYIPSDMVGATYFILLNHYDVGDYSWSTQVQFNSADGTVISEPEMETLFIEFDEWIEIRVEIDFEADVQKFYYDGTLLVEKSWIDGVSGGGAKNLGALDLYANGASNVYYDDFVLEGAGTTPQPDIEIGAITGGIGVSAEIKNVGDGDATDVNWSIILDGGLIILGKETSGTISSILAGESITVKSGLVFGIGKPTITVTADDATVETSAFVLLFLVLGL